MTKNEGNIDRILRIVAGLALLAGFFLTNASYSWLYLVGLVPLATGLLGWCAIYSLLGVSTCPMKR